MPIVVIDNATRERIKEMVDYAQKNILTINDLLDIKNGAKEPPGNKPEHCLIIPVNHRIVFSMEYQPKYGIIKHISASVPNPGEIPSRYALEMILTAFDFKNSLFSSYVYLEDIAPGCQAVNVYDVRTK